MEYRLRAVSGPSLESNSTRVWGDFPFASLEKTPLIPESHDVS